MIRRALAVWLLLMVLAIANGAARAGLLVPAMGEAAAHVVSTIALSAIIALTAVVTIPWIRPGSRREAWLVGCLWAGATLAFEFLGGHFLFQAPWDRLLADYDVRQGRIWPLVPLVTLIAPAAAARIRGLWRGTPR